jgi:hypothetical protein
MKSPVQNFEDAYWRFYTVCNISQGTCEVPKTCLNSLPLTRLKFNYGKTGGRLHFKKAP